MWNFKYRISNVQWRAFIVNFFLDILHWMGFKGFTFAKGETFFKYCPKTWQRPPAGGPVSVCEEKKCKISNIEFPTPNEEPSWWISLWIFYIEHFTLDILHWIFYIGYFTLDGFLKVSPLQKVKPFLNTSQKPDSVRRLADLSVFVKKKM